MAEVIKNFLILNNMQSSLSIPKGLGPGATIIPKAAESQIP